MRRRLEDSGETQWLGRSGAKRVRENFPRRATEELYALASMPVTKRFKTTDTAPAPELGGVHQDGN